MAQTTWNDNFLSAGNYLYSTFLNNTVTDYKRVSDRICYQLGYPLVNIELHARQIFEFINMSVEYYTKYAGYTEEFLVFDSDLYVKGKGIDLGLLVTNTPQLTATFNQTNYTSVSSDTETQTQIVSGNIDELMLRPRKIVSVTSFDEGFNSGINNLFTLEQTLAQQTYFSYAMGNYGFDLISWYVLKEWLELREKLLNTKRGFKFNDNTQFLEIYPEPKTGERFYGIVSVYMEKHIRYLLKEPWIQKYALALCKIALGNIRGKFSGTQLFGSGTMNYQDFMSQGIQEKQELEAKLLDLSPAESNQDPPMFFVG